MQVSKWEINKIGLIDFWYYDEEEFKFIDGRMLLRGANGSGKSVTMQSFIPLLLDGNKASERLDPFGTKARKLENYLLEENDDRQERTGYLYMEFKRKESDTYLTIGIGLCARKNKKLDSWHFAITDGRRIGKDFFLYKNMKEKITLTKQELINRLGEGGQVIEGQKDYMKMVNDKLFGYENVEEYKELVDLLIQLRTPKLSKDFKPTVLNEILSSSLPPLSDEDLRPMSEAIENMDNLKVQLETLQESKKASEKILETYQQYNQCVLYEKATNLVETERNYETAKKNLEELEKEQEKNQEELKNCGIQLLDLQVEEETLRKQKEELDKNNLSQLVENKQKLEQEVKESEKQLDIKKKNLEQKREQEIEAQKRLKQKNEDAQSSLSDLKEQLEEMEAGLQVISLDEHAFMSDELLANVRESYSFNVLNGQVSKLLEHLKEGIVILEQEAKMADKLEDKQVYFAKCQKEKEEKEKENELLMQQCEQAKSEWIEKFYQWLRENQELKLEEQLEQHIVVLINQFTAFSDFSEIREAVREQKEKKKSELHEKIIDLKKELEEEKAKLKESEIELQSWRDKKDPKPEQDEAVEKNRCWMRENNIFYEPLYKVIDFSEKVSKEQKNRFEEALLCMGLLDAVVVPEHYKAQVLEYREGMRDTYLFTPAETVRKSISEFLEVSMEQQDIIFYQQLSAILNSIGIEEGLCRITEEGMFGQGILHGTITGKYQAKYIGVKAREAYRQEQIGIFTELVKEKKVQTNTLENKLESFKKQIETLEEEFKNLPKEDDIKVAVIELDRVEKEIAKIEQESEKLQAEIKVIQKDLTQIRVKAADICRKVYLKSDLEIFKSAKEEIMDYQKEILRLENIHMGYLQNMELCHTFEKQLENIASDMDELRYDISKIEQGIKKASFEILQYEEQLKLEDYEAIKAKIEYCIKRLMEIPQEQKDCSKKSGSLEEAVKNLGVRRQEMQERQEKLYGKYKLMQKGFEDELSLGYVEDLAEGRQETTLQKAKRLVKILWQDTGKNSLDMAGVLQERYHKYKGEMAEFGLMIKYLFTKEEYEKDANGTEFDFRRIDIVGKYKGKEVSFPVLVEGLKEDVEIQKSLVRESDRNLFEDILAHTISKKIRLKIYNSEKWVDNMNALMGSMNTSSGLRLNLVWKKKKAEEEGQLDTGKLVELLKKDAGIMREEELEQLSSHFQSKVEEARRRMEDTGNTKSFHGIMREVLDYRKWFEFQLFFEKTGEKKKELTNNAFFTFSGGEKAMSMYVPLFSAVVAKYQGARADAPRLISLDEAFAGVDDTNIRDMFRLMVEFDFEFIINSQILWGDCDTVPSLAIYQLLRPENAKYVSVLPYKWNGKVRQMIVEESED